MKIKTVIISLLLLSTSLIQAVRITNKSGKTIKILALNKENIEIKSSQSKQVILPLSGLFILKGRSTDNPTMCNYFVLPKFTGAAEIEIQKTGLKWTARGRFFGSFGSWKSSSRTAEKVCKK